MRSWFLPLRYNLSVLINIMNNFAERSFISLSDRYVARILSNLCIDCCFFLFHISTVLLATNVYWCTGGGAIGRDRWLGRSTLTMVYDTYDSVTSELESICCINGLLIIRRWSNYSVAPACGDALSQCVLDFGTFRQYAMLQVKFFLLLFLLLCRHVDCGMDYIM